MIMKLRLRFRRKKKSIPTTPIKSNVDDGNSSIESFPAKRRKTGSAKKKSKGKKKKDTHRTPREILLERKVIELKREIKVERETWSSSRKELELRLSRAKRAMTKQETILLQQRKTIANTDLIDATKIEKKYLQEKVQTRVLSEKQTKLTLQKEGLIEQREELLEKIDTLCKENETLKNLLGTHNIEFHSDINLGPIRLNLSSPIHSPSSPTFYAKSKVQQEIEDSIEVDDSILQVSPRDILSLRHKCLLNSQDSFCYIPVPPLKPLEQKKRHSEGPIKLVKLRTKRWGGRWNSQSLLDELEKEQYEKIKAMFLDEKNGHKNTQSVTLSK